MARAAADPAALKDGTSGELTVIGSGLSISDFAVEAEDIITDAGHVFYLLYDTLARAWIKELRPDAYDLHVLYDQSVARHYTYVRMAEAMLHYVRQGKRVAAIFYGHPGVFATPTHRAVAIARQEGHRAHMRPAVSALDYLIADIGFDPALPGLLTYEATDMLLRSRIVDPSLHVVLWQVGLVGDFGYNPRGFENAGFAALIDYLVRHYGPEWRITHYIASRFRGLAPLIETYSLAEMRDPAVAKTITAISTFYIPPKETRRTDVEMAGALGLADGTYEHEFSQPDYGGYSHSDREAIASLGSVHLNDKRSDIRRGPAYRFLRALSESEALVREYCRDPQAFVDQDRWHLSPRERELLAIPHTRAFEAALYGR